MHSVLHVTSRAEPDGTHSSMFSTGYIQLLLHCNRIFLSVQTGGLSSCANICADQNWQWPYNPNQNYNKARTQRASSLPGYTNKQRTKERAGFASYLVRGVFPLHLIGLIGHETTVSERTLYNAKNLAS